MPGAFKLDHLQPFEPILSQKIFNFLTFILEGQFLLPQRANNRRGEIIRLQNRMRRRPGTETNKYNLCTKRISIWVNAMILSYKMST